MKPFDPRLLRYARATRMYLAFLVILGVLNTILIAAQIILIAHACATVFYATATISHITRCVLGLAGIFALRFALTYIQEAYGHRAALKVITDLRTQVLHHSARLGDRWLSGNTTHTVTLATRGLDDLEAYFVQFLPQLFLCVTAMPALILTLFYFDWIAGCFVIACIPLVPVFMILIGQMTAKYSAERLSTMQQLSAQLLDLLAGLSTLKGLGREHGPEQRVANLGTQFARKTMQTLYVAFLSGAVLEFLATLSTALVAVNIGFRMVGGSVLLYTGLVVIMLTPEIFKPLREVGSQFHASSNGIAAAGKAFTILQTTVIEHHGTLPVPDLRTTPLRIRNLSVHAPGRATVAPAQLDADILPQRINVLSGPSGSGKSTTVHVILGLLEPTEGEILIGDTPLREIDRRQWWSHITWVPQRPAIMPGTVLDNVCPEAKEITPELTAAAQQTGLDSVISRLPQGWHTPIGHRGTGLSVGQRQRLALTRALLSTSQIVILDEPSAHLDAISETYISEVVRQMKASGRTVIVIAHRQAITQLADHVIAIHSDHRDINDEIRNQQARNQARHIVENIVSQRADYAIPQQWAQADSSGLRKPDVSPKENA
ncbi:thiol reductant ABC exporter subunit CydD [Trueperella sp. LYQ141]|uniref:thiol reductant ABC exporter subunit CydD n=1 Tax=Trueperella sp. LYQ141 TaxID=3391058 RepID=UPI00398307AA